MVYASTVDTVQGSADETVCGQKYVDDAAAPRDDATGAIATIVTALESRDPHYKFQISVKSF